MKFLNAHSASLPLFNLIKLEEDKEICKACNDIQECICKMELELEITIEIVFIKSHPSFHLLPISKFGSEIIEEIKLRDCEG